MGLIPPPLPFFIYQLFKDDNVVLFLQRVLHTLKNCDYRRFTGYKNRNALTVCLCMFPYIQVRNALRAHHVYPPVCPHMHSLQPLQRSELNFEEWFPTTVESSRLTLF